MSALPRMNLAAPTGLISHKCMDGWTLLEEGPRVEGEPALDFLGFLRRGETYINGETFLARASKMDGSESGQRHLECMLRQADRIPVELRPYHLVATGTKWRGVDGYLYLPVLFFEDGWELGFSRVDRSPWVDRDRVVRVYEPPGS